MLFSLKHSLEPLELSLNVTHNGFMQYQQVKTCSWLKGNSRILFSCIKMFFSIYSRVTWKLCLLQNQNWEYVCHLGRSEWAISEPDLDISSLRYHPTKPFYDSTFHSVILCSFRIGSIYSIFHPSFSLTCFRTGFLCLFKGTLTRGFHHS